MNKEELALSPTPFHNFIKIAADVKESTLLFEKSRGCRCQCVIWPLLVISFTSHVGNTAINLME